MIRYGIIGCGMIANFHAKALRSVEGAQLRGVWDVRPDSAAAFAQKWGVRAYDALESLLHLHAGSVSPLALHYDEEHQITLCYEKELEIAPKLVFHPCDSTASLVLVRDVFWERLLPLMQVRPVAVDCTAENG